MLARLEALAGVEHAAIDYRGDLLKLALDDERALGLVTALLNELGYGAEPASGPDLVGVDVWYDRASIGELSRVEAEVIADRIMPPFARAQNLAAPQNERVRAAVVDALHDCFVRHGLRGEASLGAFRTTCEHAVEERVRPILGPASATELTRALSLDMSEDHRND